MLLISQVSIISYPLIDNLLSTIDSLHFIDCSYITSESGFFCSHERVKPRRLAARRLTTHHSSTNGLSCWLHVLLLRSSLSRKGRANGRLNSVILLRNLYTEAEISIK